jgi:hypothetical protein
LAKYLFLSSSTKERIPSFVIYKKEGVGDGDFNKYPNNSSKKKKKKLKK